MSRRVYCLVEECRLRNCQTPPMFQMLIRTIERHDLTTPFLYSMNGEANVVNTVYREIRNGITESISDNIDVHVLTSALKRFLADFDEALIPQNLQEDFIGTIDGNLDSCIMNGQRMLCMLPLAHYYTLKMLIQHLRLICKYAKHNHMNEKNLAKIFSVRIFHIIPSRLIRRYTGSVNILVGLASALLEFFMVNFDDLFVIN